MAVNDFYTSSGYPSFNANGDSASARAEFNLVNVGFDKLPALTGFALKIIRVNAAGNALESVALSTAKILASDGSVAATADIPLGGFKITGLGAATVNGESVRFEQVGVLAASQLAINSINDTHIDWGNGANQVSAVDVPNTPAGNIAATDIQAALNELDTEKAIDSGVVHIAGSESITGQKTLTAPLATADATAALGLATKQQVVEKTAGTGSAVMPNGTTAQRDVSPVNGFIRYNSTDNVFEGFQSGVWGTLSTTNNLHAKVSGIQASQITFTNSIIKKLYFNIINFDTDPNRATGITSGIVVINGSGSDVHSGYFYLRKTGLWSVTFRTYWTSPSGTGVSAYSLVYNRGLTGTGTTIESICNADIRNGAQLSKTHTHIIENTIANTYYSLDAYYVAYTAGSPATLNMQSSSIYAEAYISYLGTQ